MNQDFAVWLLILCAVLAANLPWLSARVLLVVRRRGGKPFWVRLLEWLAYYCITGLLAVGMERKMTGNVYHQGWEFYTVTLFTFAIFALPGFIYHYQIRRSGTND